MSKASLVVVLAEDARHQQFVRQYLYQLRYSRHDIRFEPLPSGRGCGEQWVRKRYVETINAYRARAARARTALIVAIDADTQEVNWRLRQLQDALERNALPPRTVSESIVHLIPKRNVETWILCLNGGSVDEVTDYHHEHGIEQLIMAAAAAFHEWSRPNVAPPSNCIPSLRAAIPEVRRLEP